MKTKHLLLLIGFSSAIAVVKATPPDEGRSIFLSNCAACHTINKNLIGPALAGVDKRRSMDWIISFVHSSQTLVKSGDSTAVSMYEKFNKVMMPDHPTLTDENIKSIIAYIQSEAKPTGGDKAPFAKPGKLNPAYLPLSIHNYGFFTAYFITVIILVSVLYCAVWLKTFQRTKDAAGTTT